MSEQQNGSKAVELLQAILAEQSRNNQLLSILVNSQQRNEQSTQTWKQEHAELSSRCTRAVKKANNFMTSLLEQMVTEIEGLEEESWDSGAFVLDEFITKHGPKFQQFSLIINALAHLSH